MMRRLITFGVLVIGLCAVLTLGGATQPSSLNMPQETVYYWHRGDTSLGNMVVDSSDGAAAYVCTTSVTSRQWNTDSVLFKLYVKGASTTGTDDTVWIVAQGLDRWFNAIDTSLLVIDTLATENLFTVWNTKCISWPYMRLLLTLDEDTTGTGYAVDTFYAASYALQAR
jgi:hypothetical protein